MAMTWGWVAALLAGYGFLKEVRPSEPYITQFLTGPDKNLTEQQVNQSIYPISTYSTLSLLVVLFLVTDYLRYKPIVVLQGLSAVATYSILSWGQGVPMMQVVEVLYGLMWAADVAYFTYMYAKVGREHYGTVSAAARVGYLVGRGCSGVLSQLTVSLDLMSLLDLQYFTLATSAGATALALSLPSVATSFYFHKAAPAPAKQADADAESPAAGVEPQHQSSSLLRVASLLWADCREAFSQRTVVKWSAWWALATAGQMQALNYVQILWQTTVRENGGGETLWNGASEAAYTLLGAGVVWLTTRKKDYSSWGDALMSVFFLAAGVVWVVAANSQSMAVQYAVSISFGAAYHAAITIANSEVAKRVREDAHALVFGINTLAGLLVQTALTLAVAGDGGLALDIRTQFVVYGAYFLLIGVTLLVVTAFASVRRCLRASETINVQTYNTH